jgi:hypothetical protein
VNNKSRLTSPGSQPTTYETGFSTYQTPLSTYESHLSTLLAAISNLSTASTNQFARFKTAKLPIWKKIN